MAYLVGVLDGIGWSPKKFSLTPKELDFSEGKIQLCDVEDVVMLPSPSAREFSVKTSTRNFLIRANTKEEAERWYDCIKFNAKIVSPNFGKTEGMVCNAITVSEKTGVMIGAEVNTYTNTHPHAALNPYAADNPHGGKMNPKLRAQSDCLNVPLPNASVVNASTETTAIMTASTTGNRSVRNASVGTVSTNLNASMIANPSASMITDPSMRESASTIGNSSILDASINPSLFGASIIANPSASMIADPSNRMNESIFFGSSANPSLLGVSMIANPSASMIANPSIQDLESPNNPHDTSNNLQENANFQRYEVHSMLKDVNCQRSSNGQSTLQPHRIEEPDDRTSSMVANPSVTIIAERDKSVLRNVDSVMINGPTTSLITESAAKSVPNCRLTEQSPSSDSIDAFLTRFIKETSTKETSYGERHDYLPLILGRAITRAVQHEVNDPIESIIQFLLETKKSVYTGTPGYYELLNPALNPVDQAIILYAKQKSLLGNEVNNEEILASNNQNKKIQLVTGKNSAMRNTREQAIVPYNNYHQKKPKKHFDRYVSENWKWYIHSVERQIDFLKLPEIPLPDNLDLKRFTCFLPRTIMDLIHQGKITNHEIDTHPGGVIDNPVVGRRKACLVFTDASGFTAMTEKLARKPNGAEKLGSFLNTFFGLLIDIIDKWQGDILKFSGDAVTILFPCDEEWETDVHDTNTKTPVVGEDGKMLAGKTPVVGAGGKTPRTTSTQRRIPSSILAPLQAAACCQEIHSKLSHFPTPAEGVFFSFHIGVGYGECVLMQVGGTLGRFEYCATGEAFPQISKAEPIAVSTQTCASPEFLEQFENSRRYFQNGAPEVETEKRGQTMTASVEEKTVTIAELDKKIEHARKTAILEHGGIKMGRKATCRKTQRMTHLKGILPHQTRGTLGNLPANLPANLMNRGTIGTGGSVGNGDGNDPNKMPESQSITKLGPNALMSGNDDAIIATANQSNSNSNFSLGNSIPKKLRQSLHQFKTLSHHSHHVKAKAMTKKLAQKQLVSQSITNKQPIAPSAAAEVTKRASAAEFTLFGESAEGRVSTGEGRVSTGYQANNPFGSLRNPFGGVLKPAMHHHKNKRQNTGVSFDDDLTVADIDHISEDEDGNVVDHVLCKGGMRKSTILGTDGRTVKKAHFATTGRGTGWSTLCLSTIGEERSDVSKKNDARSTAFESDNSNVGNANIVPNTSSNGHTILLNTSKDMAIEVPHTTTRTGKVHDTKSSGNENAVSHTNPHTNPDMNSSGNENAVHEDVILMKKPHEDTWLEGYKIMGEIDPSCFELFRPSNKYKPPPDFNVRMLQRYIPRSEFNSLILGAHFEEELRKVSVIFLSMASDKLDCNTEEGCLKTQKLLCSCQRAIYALEGSLNKFVVDDKGMLLLCCFGLPPLSHFGDDPARATIAGLRMLDILKVEGVQGSVGVATGVVWCGVIGNLKRREYTVLGDVVNLSARLMGNAGPDSILCDVDTMRCLRELNFEVRVLDPIHMKGKANRVPIFRPTGRILKPPEILHRALEKYLDENHNIMQITSEMFVVEAQMNVPLGGSISPNQQLALEDPTILTTDNKKLKQGRHTRLANFWAQRTGAKKLRECVIQQLREGGGITVVTGDAGTGKHEILDGLRLMSKNLGLKAKAIRGRSSSHWSENRSNTVYNQRGYNTVYNNSQSGYNSDGSGNDAGMNIPPLYHGSTTYSYNTNHGYTTANTDEFTLLEGNTLNPTKTHAVQFLPIQRIFNKLGEELRKDTELLAEIKERTGKTCRSMIDIVRGMVSEENADFLPLLSAAMTTIEFGDAVVKAAADYDFRHDSRNRLMELCIEVLDFYSRRRKVVILLDLQRSATFFEEFDPRTYVFANYICRHIMENRRHPSSNNGNNSIKQSSITAISKGKSSIGKTAAILDALDAEERTGGLVFLLCARSEKYGLILDSPQRFQRVFEWARCMNSFIELQNFDRDTTIIYFKHQLIRALEWDFLNLHCLTLPYKMEDFLMSMTIGNAHLINIVAEFCVYESICLWDQQKNCLVWYTLPADDDDYIEEVTNHVDEEPEKPNSSKPDSTTSMMSSSLLAAGTYLPCLESEAAVEYLRTVQIDGVLGIAFSQFDRLTARQQGVMKVCAGIQMDVFCAFHIAEAQKELHSPEESVHSKGNVQKELETVFQELADRGILCSIDVTLEERKLDPLIQRMMMKIGLHHNLGIHHSLRRSSNNRNDKSNEEIAQLNQVNKKLRNDLINEQVMAVPFYSFKADFYRLAAEKLVLQSQYVILENLKDRLGIHKIKGCLRRTSTT